MKLSSIASTLVILIASVYILIAIEGYLIPLIVALIIWFIIDAIKDGLETIPFIRDKVPNWIKSIMPFLVLVFVLGMLVELLISNIQQLAQVIPLYQSNIRRLNEVFMATFEVDAIAWLENYGREYDFTNILQNSLNAISTILSDGFMITIYVIFIIGEEAMFTKKLRLLYKDEAQYQRMQKIIAKISKSFSSYITLKSLVSLVTGVLSYGILRFIGIDFALFWAFLIFVLNFIPNIGSLIATMFPVLAAVLQYGEWLPALWVFIGVGSIQIIVGNFVEPKLMGDSLNISSLVVIIALVTWGAIWGILGMILSVPITIMMIIIFSQFHSTKPIAIMLSQNGEIDAL